MTRARGGKAVYGASVGMLLLQTRFPRIPGDGGNAATWPFPMLWRVVGGATPDRVVRDREGVVDDFVAAGRELVAMGADGITTNCGFLVLYQDQLSMACGVPVATSSLLQVPWVERLLPAGPAGRRGDGGSGKSLTAAAPRMRWRTTGHSGRGDRGRRRAHPGPARRPARARRGPCAGGCPCRRPSGSSSATGMSGRSFVECTNMPPYAADLSRATGLPVHDFHSFRVLVPGGAAAEIIRRVKCGVPPPAAISHPNHGTAPLTRVGLRRIRYGSLAA